jgi:hypothetical protein
MCDMLDSGMMLYPSGDKHGIWWKVSDEPGNEGWVPSTLFNLAKQRQRKRRTRCRKPGS